MLVRPWPLIALQLLLLFFAPLRGALAAACPGDCDASQSVSINELITVVSIALGNSPLSACTAGDTNDDGSVGIDELIAAVNAALHGCPPPAGDKASPALAVVRGLSEVPELTQVLTLTIDGLGGPEMCPLSGTEQDACEDSGTGSLRDVVTANHCRVDTPEGPTDFNGGVVITASGQCPDVLLPFNIGFAFASDEVIESSVGTPLLDVRIDAKITINSFSLGSPPCHIKGATATIDGPIVFHGPDGHDVTLACNQVQDVVQFLDFDANCDPATLVSTLDGAVRIDDTYGSEPFGLDATLHQYVITSHRATNQFELSGTVDSPCLGNSVRFATGGPVGVGLGQTCLSGGTLAIGLPAGTAQLALGDDGSVQISGGASYASCLDLPRNACE
jgi:hypothetical protein